MQLKEKIQRRLNFYNKSLITLCCINRETIFNQELPSLVEGCILNRRYPRLLYDKKIDTLILEPILSTNICQEKYKRQDVLAVVAGRYGTMENLKFFQITLQRREILVKQFLHFLVVVGQCHI